MAKIKVEVEIKDAYDVEEAAAILLVGVATIWRWIASSKLASFKLGGRTLISDSEIRRVQGLKTERAPVSEGALNSKSGGET
jgi:excisionase family DNA binding protein